jgi:hypothetical protein
LLTAVEGELAIHDDWYASATTWHPDENEIEVGGVGAEVGDRVALGGGESVRADNLDKWDWLVAPNAGCLAQDGVWFAWSLERL